MQGPYIGQVRSEKDDERSEVERPMLMAPSSKVQPSLKTSANANARARHEPPADTIKGFCRQSLDPLCA